MTRKAALHWILLLLASSLIPSCTRPASTVPAVIASPHAPTIRISGVKVTQASGIFIQGESSLAEGSCIQTAFYIAGQPTAWWPKDVCIQTASGQWEILVPLGRRGAPAQLSPGDTYEIRAWWPDDAEKVSVRFPLVIR